MKPIWFAVVAAAAVGALFAGIASQGTGGLLAAPTDGMAGDDPGSRTEIVCLSPSVTNREAAWAKAFRQWADGTTEHRIAHGRVDVLTASLAIEVDWLDKFHEGIGQALHYSMATGKPAGLALIVKPAQAPLDATSRSKVAVIEELSQKHGISLFLLYTEMDCPAPPPARAAMR